MPRMGIVLLGLALLASTATADAETRPPPAEIEYIYPDQSIWTAHINPGDTPLNPLLAVAQSLFEKAGVPWHATPYPAARMFSQLRGGAPVFSMLVAAPGLRECCVVSRAPVARTELRLYWRGATPPLHRVEDLAGKAVATIRGYSYGEMAAFLTDERNAVSRTVVDGHRAAFQMLEYGRAEYVLDYAGPAAEVLAAHPAADIRWTKLADVNIHMVLARSYPGAETMMHRLEAAAARLDTEALIRTGLNPDPAR